jgi:hypothetical protein
MVIGKVLSADHSVHISLHEFLEHVYISNSLSPKGTISESYLDEIDLSECFIAPWLLDVKNRDDVFVVEVPEQLHLTQGSQAEHGVVEGGDLLDSNLLSGGFMECRAISELVLL